MNRFWHRSQYQFCIIRGAGLNRKRIFKRNKYHSVLFINSNFNFTKEIDMSLRAYEFSWDIIGDIREGRPNLGDKVHIVLYRLMQYTFRDIAEQHYGKEICDSLFYDAGYLAGKFFFDHYLKDFKDLPLGSFVAELQQVLKDLGVGIFRVEKANSEAGEFVVTVSEDLDCSGLPDLGIEVCNYDEGFISGIFEKFTGKVFNVREVDCWCTGDRTCRFEVNQTVPAVSNAEQPSGQVSKTAAAAAATAMPKPDQSDDFVLQPNREPPIFAAAVSQPVQTDQFIRQLNDEFSKITLPLPELIQTDELFCQPSDSFLGIGEDFLLID
jgi:predicted hydrocarbon binding protein